MTAILVGVNVTSGGTADGMTTGVGGGTPNAITAAQLLTLQSGGADWNSLSSTMSTLVADGASPTSAHVSAANVAYTALMADLATVVAGGAHSPFDVAVIVNQTNVPTRNVISRALRKIERNLAGNGGFTE